jgi:hypothetical protein
MDETAAALPPGRGDAASRSPGGPGRRGGAGAGEQRAARGRAGTGGRFGTAGPGPGAAADPDRYVRSVEDVLQLLDGLFDAGADRWTVQGARWRHGFYTDRSKPVPFFVAKPDESLASWLERGTLPPGGRALDLGCGPGRNSLHLAAQGFEVDAVDLSAAAVTWARERADDAGADVRFHCGDAFTLTGTALRGRTT